MKAVAVATTVLLFCAVVQPIVARAETAAEAFAAGQALLAKADIDGALKAFTRAAQADRTNQEYMQNYAQLRQVVMLRKQLGTEQDAARWEYAARALHAFYVAHALHGETLALDRQIHARLNNASSAVMLAETQLSLGKDAEAVQTLSSIPAAEQTADTQSLRALALARQGNVADAKRLAADMQVGDNAGPGLLYRLARFNAAVGEDQQAVGYLTRCFESVSPSRIDSFKQHARQTPEFVSLSSSPAFATALKTESKVAESKCSGGSRCSSCPMRGQCNKGQDH